MNIIIPTIYIPTFHGDVRLERVSDKETRVIVAKATPLEQSALRELAEYAVKKKWLEETNKAVFDEGSFILGAAIEKIQSRLAKALKPGREVVTVVRFNDGKMEEIVEAPLKVQEPTESVKDTAAKEEKKETRIAKAAAAVAAPYRGCPPPAFAHSELRANRVLETFLSPEQREDFRAHNRFITVGAVTGHRYMVTSRYAPSELSIYGGRSFFDMEEDKPMCVHDWEVPAAEEMLALHLLASVPAHEIYLRRLENEEAYDHLH